MVFCGSWIHHWGLRVGLPTIWYPTWQCGSTLLPMNRIVGWETSFNSVSRPSFGTRTHYIGKPCYINIYMYQYNVWQILSNCGIGEVMAKGLFDCKWFKCHFFIFTESKDHKKVCPLSSGAQSASKNVSSMQHGNIELQQERCINAECAQDRITWWPRSVGEWSCLGITHTFWRNTEIPKSYWWLSTPFSILKACRKNSQFIVPTYQWPRPANGKFYVIPLKKNLAENIHTVSIQMVSEYYDIPPNGCECPFGKKKNAKISLTEDIAVPALFNVFCFFLSPISGPVSFFHTDPIVFP